MFSSKLDLIDYSALSDVEVLDLHARCHDLREDAKEQLRTELIQRGLCDRETINEAMSKAAKHQEKRNSKIRRIRGRDWAWIIPVSILLQRLVLIPILNSWRSAGGLSGIEHCFIEGASAGISIGIVMIFFRLVRSPSNNDQILEPPLRSPQDEPEDPRLAALVKSLQKKTDT